MSGGRGDGCDLAVAALLAIYGYDWLHRIFRWCFFVCLPLYALLTVAIMLGKVPATHSLVGGFSAVAFAGQFAASASYNITYAPSVSDYSRYLPRSTSRYSIIAAVYAGAASSAIWLIAVGAWLATRLGASDGLVALNDAGNALLPGFGAVLLLCSVAALTAATGLNAYSGMLTVVTALNSLFQTRPTARLQSDHSPSRFAVVWATLALRSTANSDRAVVRRAHHDAVSAGALDVDPTPTSITFFVRRGRYEIPQLFVVNGIYGAWGARGLAAYVIGFAATRPFFVLPGV